MGAMTAIMVGLGAATAVQQVVGGYAQKKEAQANAQAIKQESIYNAGVYEQQAAMTEEAKQLKMQQDDRLIRFAAGKHVAVTSAKGLQLSGSALAILNDSMTQMEMDKNITAYNFDMEKYALKSQAESTVRRGNTLSAQYLRGGDTAMMSGVAGGLTTLMQTGFYVNAKNYAPKSINTTSGAMIGGKP
jgi:hypothetical protein